jgi:hypothetical protein
LQDAINGLWAATGVISDFARECGAVALSRELFCGAPRRLQSVAGSGEIE